jgi:hypothetical protein
MMFSTTTMLSMWYMSPFPPACQVMRSHVPGPCAVWSTMEAKNDGSGEKERTRAAPVPGRLRKSMRREVKASGVMLVLSAESRMFGEVVPSTEEEMVIVRSGCAPCRS